MLYENNQLYTLMRFLVIMFGTTCMTITTVRFTDKYKKKLIIFCFFVAYAIVVTWPAIHFGGWGLVLKIYGLTITLPAMIIMFFLSGEPLPRLIFTRITQLLFSAYIAVSATLLNGLLHGTMLSSLLLLILLYAVVIFLEYRFLLKTFMYLADTIRKGWGILALIPCVLLVLSMLVGLYPKHYTKNPTAVVFLYLLLAVILIIYFAVFRYLTLLHTSQMSERNMEILELQVQNIRRENENMKALEKQNRIIRHDMRHMLSVIASLAKNEDAQAILDYIDKFTAQNTISESPQYCSDPFLDTTFSHYFNRAKSRGFALETSLSVPDTLPVDPAEFAICFANALECAMNVSENIPEEKEKKITVRCDLTPKS